MGNASFGDILSVVARTHRDMTRLLVELMAQEGLTDIVSSHGDILIQLFTHKSMSMAQIAEAIGRDPSTVTALVRKLIAAGYVEKSENLSDRRIREVALTAQGRALQPAVERISTELITVISHNIDANDLKATYRTMETIQTNVEERLEQGDQDDSHS